MDMMWYRRRGLMVTPHLESVTGSIASFNSDYNKIRIKSLVCNINPIQEGSGDPSPENVRPISGRTGLSTWRTGNNLCPVYDRSVGALWGTNYAELTNFLNTLEVGTYSLKNKYRIEELPTNSENVMHAYIFIRAYVNGKYVYLNSYRPITDNSPSVGKTYQESTIFTITEETKGHITDSNLYCDSEVHTGSGRGKFYLYDIFIEKGSSDVDYEPYKGSTYSVKWETEAGTVYGGYVDVVSGKLTVDRAIVDLGELNWVYSSNWGGSGAFYCNPAPPGIKTANPELIIPNALCSSYAVYSRYFLYTNPSAIGSCVPNGTGQVSIRDSNFTDANAFKVAMSGVQFVYELSIPINYQLTPQQVKTLVENNIWCDSGDVSVDYWKWGN